MSEPSLRNQTENGTDISTMDKVQNPVHTRDNNSHVSEIAALADAPPIDHSESISSPLSDSGSTSSVNFAPAFPDVDITV